MKPNNDLEYSHEEICSMFSYDKVSGGLKWKHREPSSLKNRQWNGRFANKTAGTIRKDGYLRVKVGCRYILVHRLIWFIEFGEFPSFLIDHINGNKSDNRLSNLQVTDKQGNARNSKLPSHNSSGVIGVCWSKVSNKWRSYINVKGQQHHLGLFEDFQDAVLAREKASIDFNFSSLHGRNDGN